jgi:hypothetical protein
MFKHYFDDGANWQAQAVACYLNHTKIEESWSEEKSAYLASPSISRWENCREQGYVISLRAANLKQINIAFFEHRNSDSICTVEWEQNTMNAPTIDTAEFGNIYKDKYDTSASFSYGEVVAAGDWILDRLDSFWTNNLKPTT